jgi:ankyrin repeat protein
MKRARGDEDDLTALMAAAEKDGARVDTTNEYGYTALMLAAAGGHVAAIETLVKHGARVETANELYGGVTALMLASRHTAAIEALVKHGANIEAVSKSGMTALMYAACGGSTEVVESLVMKHGARAQAVAEDGSTALMGAACGGHVSCGDHRDPLGARRVRRGDRRVRLDGSDGRCRIRSHGGH